MDGKIRLVKFHEAGGKDPDLPEERKGELLSMQKSVQRNKPSNALLRRGGVRN